MRKACYLWERFTGQTLERAVDPKGPYVPLFDPATYVTVAGTTDARWRIRNNGLGNRHYGPCVRRTKTIETLLAQDTLGRFKAFAKHTNEQMLDRALAWAYLHETESSYEIERETPSQNKAETFVALLRQAHLKQPLSEDYLVELQTRQTPMACHGH